MASKRTEAQAPAEAVADAVVKPESKPEPSKGTQVVDGFSIDWEVVTRNDHKGRPNIKEMRVAISHPNSPKVERAILALKVSS
jgi:hypothetical protein